MAFSNRTSPLLRVKHFYTWCIGWSTASAPGSPAHAVFACAGVEAVQLRSGNKPALAAEATETLPQALKRDLGTDGSHARLKACSTHRLNTTCEAAIGFCAHVFFPASRSLRAPSQLRRAARRRCSGAHRESGLR